MPKGQYQRGRRLCPHCGKPTAHIKVQSGNRRGRKTIVSSDKHQEIADAYKLGQTLQSLSVKYGVTRERIRQILLKFDLTRENGAQAFRRIPILADRAKKRAAFEIRRDARSVRLHGLPWTEYAKAAGVLIGGRKANRVFLDRRNASRQTDQEWNLLFVDWFKFWIESGRKDHLGRGYGYHMTRINETLPWQVGNLRIVYGPEFQAEMRHRDWGARHAESAP